MYGSHDDYAPLRDLVDDAITERRRDHHPDFSTAGLKIDDIIDEEKLHMFDPSVVAEVAVLYGFDVDVCRYGSLRHTHEGPRMRANGIWLDMPSGLEDKFRQGGEYMHLEDPTMCPSCADSYMKEAKMTRSIGAEGIHRFTASHQLMGD